MAATMPLALGLSLGFGTATVSAVGGKSAFTFMQMQELEQQVLIYKYMVAGLPVPVHLVLPIWKSVAAAAAVVCGGDCSHFPTFSGSGCLRLDYMRNNLEPEPGRCRRTDGKKWRCSRDVVPDQKYCDRHLHRGRTRKPSAAAATADFN
ncbi:Growth-regulating factor 12 [Platanthera guangdongensis]|uniref:Growth-regulating factor n=1 Tax=Platanthera guangdongensis TaxID=2320717 RepID=A0ABR2MJL7_9ASPA